MKWVGVELGDVEPIIARLQGSKVNNVMPGLDRGDAALPAKPQEIT